MNALEGRSLPAAAYYLLLGISYGRQRMPVTEPKIAHLERLFAEGFVQVDGEFLRTCGAGREFLRSAVYSLESGCFYWPAKSLEA
jgi:hypothetical protein